jgi:solute carrier family 25 phosphate transporter 23/24/25/41
MATLIIKNSALHCGKLVRTMVTCMPNLRMSGHGIGIAATSEIVSDFILSLSSEPHSQQINFADFRDFFILLPRKASTAEIYQYYEVRRYMGDDGRGPARVNMEGAWHLTCPFKFPVNYL